MTVNDLINKLVALRQPDALVVMSRDSEGNTYSPLSGIDASANYAAENTWSGEVGLRELTPELEAKGYSDEDVSKDGVPAIVFYPTH